MTSQFDELPHWDFSEREDSPGVYTVKALRDSGTSGSSTGSDPDALLHDLKTWAKRVEIDLQARRA